MSIVEQSTLYNIVGILSILVLSVFVGRSYPSPFFQNWIRAYAGGLLLLICEFVANRMGRLPWLTLVEIALLTAICWCFVRTGQILQQREPLALRVLAVMLVASLTLCSVLLANRLPFEVVCGPFVLTYAFLHGWLGYQLIRSNQHARPSGAMYLGIPLIASGVWFALYPIVERSSLNWVGYLVSAILNLLVGVGMVIFLIEDTACKLRVKNEALTRLDQLKSLFINLMSQEFKSPLTSVSSAVWLLRHGSPVPLTPFQEELIDTVQEQTRVLERLLNDILDYARAETSTLRYKFARISLTQLTEGIARAMRPIFERGNVDFAYESCEDELIVEADGDRIKQVVMNLLNNALKFTPAGGEVRLTLSHREESAVVIVSDTGPGIAKEHHEAIFERFFQLDTSGVEAATGLGLGLPLSRAIIEQGHRGKLSVDATVVVGARFVITLPKQVLQHRETVFTLAGTDV